MYLEAVGRSGERESGNCEERERERGTEGSEGEGSGHHLSSKKIHRRRGEGPTPEGRGRLFKLLPGILAVLPNDLAVRLWLLPPPSAPSHGC